MNRPPFCFDHAQLIIIIDYAPGPFLSISRFPGVQKPLDQYGNQSNSAAATGGDDDDDDFDMFGSDNEEVSGCGLVCCRDDWCLYI